MEWLADYSIRMLREVEAERAKTAKEKKERKADETEMFADPPSVADIVVAGAADQ